MKNTFNYAMQAHDELMLVKANHTAMRADIRRKTIHSIVNAVLALNKEGVEFTMNFGTDGISIYRRNEVCAYVKNADGYITLDTEEDLIHALEQIESIQIAKENEETEDDITSIFAKEDECDA